MIKESYKIKRLIEGFFIVVECSFTSTMVKTWLQADTEVVTESLSLDLQAGWRERE